MKRITTCGMAIGLMLIAWIGEATRVERLSLTEIRDHSSSIVIAVVTFEETRLAHDDKMVWTDYRLLVEEVLSGAKLGPSHVLSFAGGEAEGRDIGIAGVPRLEAGRRYVLFLLAGGTPWATPTVGWGQGIFEVVPAFSSDQPRVLVSLDGEPLEISSAGLVRGEMVRRSERWIELPQRRDDLRSPREIEPEVFNADDKAIEQPARIPDPAPRALDQRTFATLSQLREFVRGEIQEDSGGHQ